MVLRQKVFPMKSRWNRKIWSPSLLSKWTVQQTLRAFPVRLLSLRYCLSLRCTECGATAPFRTGPFECEACLGEHHREWITDTYMRHSMWFDDFMLHARHGGDSLRLVVGLSLAARHRPLTSMEMAFELRVTRYMGTTWIHLMKYTVGRAAGLFLPPEKRPQVLEKHWGDVPLDTPPGTESKPRPGEAPIGCLGFLFWGCLVLPLSLILILILFKAINS